LRLDRNIDDRARLPFGLARYSAIEHHASLRVALVSVGQALWRAPQVNIPDLDTGPEVSFASQALCRRVHCRCQDVTIAWYLLASKLVRGGPIKAG
jgi:hypothetical protein